MTYEPRRRSGGSGSYVMRWKRHCRHAAPVLRADVMAVERPGIHPERMGVGG